MQAEIYGEDEVVVGVNVKDLNDVEHTIQIEYDGSIYAHHQDGYPDKAAERTAEGTEHVNQARRYARWHVYRERGYDTLEAGNNPDRILAALIAITNLSEEVFNDYFGDLQSQIESHYNDKTVDLPFDDASPDDVIIYRKDVSVEPDPTTFDPPVLEQFLARFEGESDSQEIPSKDTIERTDLEALDFDVTHVSEMHYLHTDGLGTERTSGEPDSSDRDPDAVIELVPFDLAEIESFHRYVVSHLAYQIRDCFLRMGVKPPMVFRAQGWGKYRSFHEQKFCPQYENYWDPNATITTWEPS